MSDLLAEALGKLVRKEKQALISEFLKMLDNLPTEHVTWITDKKIKHSVLGERGTVQSSMIFLPEIMRIKLKLREMLK